MRGRSEEHEQSESSLRAESSKIARPSAGKPQDLQRKGRTTTASHGTLAGSINSRHGLLYGDVACLDVCRRSWGVQSRAVAICVGFVDVGACDGLRIARGLELSLLTLCLGQARAPCGSAVNPEKASDFHLHFRHAPCHAASASRFNILEDTQNVIPPSHTAFKMPLGRFAFPESLPHFLQS